VQHPFWGGVSPLNPMRSSVLFLSVNAALDRSTRRTKAAPEETARWMSSGNGYCFIFSMK